MFRCCDRRCPPGLRLCSPAPARNRQQEKQLRTVQETYVADGIAPGARYVQRVYAERIQNPKEQRHRGTKQPQPITHYRKLFFHPDLQSNAGRIWPFSLVTLLRAHQPVKRSSCRNIAGNVPQYPRCSAMFAEPPGLQLALLALFHHASVEWLNGSNIMRIKLGKSGDLFCRDLHGVLQYKPGHALRAGRSRQ